MSEIINNREQLTNNPSKRQAILKQIFKDLHDGKNVAEVKAHFDAFIGKITIEEISQLQHDFEDLSGEEMHRLHAKHTEIFKGSIEEIEKTNKPEEQPGHPIHTFILENKEIDKLVNTQMKGHIEQFDKEDSPENVFTLLEDINLLLDIDKHYSRKENLIFPYLETYGIFGPTTNMWRINDFIRDAIKDARQKLSTYNGDKQSVIDVLKFVIYPIYCPNKRVRWRKKNHVLINNKY
jgi:uncharacterized protein